MNFEKIYNNSNKSLKEVDMSHAQDSYGIYTKSKEYKDIEYNLYGDALEFFGQKMQEFESTSLMDAQEQTGVEDGEADAYNLKKIDTALSDLAQAYCDLLRYQTKRDHK